MSEPFLAEIRIVGFNFAPRGWAQCDGQILPINQYQSLYSLLGTTYGGDGRTSFALPDLRSRLPMHTGSNGTVANHTLGEKSGQENQILTEAQIPSHTHSLRARDAGGNSGSPVGHAIAREGLGMGTNDFRTSPPNVNMRAGAIASAGGQGHPNVQPYQVLNFVIALTGLFPSRN